MAEMQLVPEHPNGCVACQSPTGPFVVIGLAGWTVNTVNGPFQVDTDVVFCAARDGREGCAGQLARTAGYFGADEKANLVGQYEQVLAANGELEAKVQELEADKTLNAEELAKKVAAHIIAEAG